MTRVAQSADVQPSPAPVSRGILQRACACGGVAKPGGECESCRRKKGIQSKRRVNAPGDRYEREADRMADAVMRQARPKAPTPVGDALLREAVSDEEDRDERRLFRSAAGPGAAPASARHAASRAAPPIVDRVLSRPGAPLDPGTAARMQAGYGHDFSRVRVHADPLAARSADAVAARAYTSGRHVVFGAGQYRPEAPEGQRLIAHELAHVMQQGAAPRLAAGLAVTPASDQLQRQDEPDGPGVAEAGQSLSEGEGGATPDYEGGQEGAGPGGEVSLVNRIVVSCPESVIVFETPDGSLAYELTNCEEPSAGFGDYTAAVSVDGNLIVITFPTLDGELFRFNYTYHATQKNPARLIENQSEVAVTFTSDLLEFDHAPGCLRVDPNPPASISNPGSPPIELPTEIELLRRQTIDPPIQLFEPYHFGPHTVFSKNVPIGKFGWIEISAQVGADATGTLTGHYGPLDITDICFTGVQSDGTVIGSAVLEIDAGLLATVTGRGTIEIPARYLSLFELGSIDGEIRATGTASAGGRVRIATRLRRDAQRNWHPSGAMEITAIGGLGFRLDASVGLRGLGMRLWSNTWNLVDASVSGGWRGGLALSEDMEFSALPGGLFDGLEGSEIGITSASGGGPGGRGPGSGGSRLSLPDLTDRLFALDPTDSFSADVEGIMAGPVCPQTPIRPIAIGSEVHPIIEDMFIGESSDRFKEVPIPEASTAAYRDDPHEAWGDRGFVDFLEVTRRTPDSVLVSPGEIKAMNHRGFTAGYFAVREVYGPKIVEHGPSCALPRADRTRAQNRFCRYLNAEGKTVGIDPSQPLKNWPPAPRHFEMRMGRQMRLSAENMAPGVTGYKCLGWVETPALPAAGGPEDAAGSPAPLEAAPEQIALPAAEELEG